MRDTADRRFLTWYKSLPREWRAAINGLIGYLDAKGRDVEEPRAKRIESSRTGPTSGS